MLRLELRWVILDTFILTYLYGLFRFREGATKQHYDIEAKKDSAQPLLPENSEGKIRNAARTAGNLSEQLPMFVLCMWLYAQVRPVVAAIMGAFYLAFLLLYPILYGDNFNQYVAFSTVPRYIINEYMAVSFVLKAFDLV